MDRSITLTSDAVDKREGMTLEELAAFVAEAYALQLPDGTRIRVEAGFRQQIKQIKTH
ncbi:hypothetical protein [Brevibacterium gallinarum]|uniref:Uncharacterized protein n=1 Tax=Brevibacterium gallinarum TaxID=2762220 RepID=A0ABR8WR20_9MICO|nr:hypothetical protein [Brevibacterium gallinarum]MBD8019372.1 hypothetical protein [Brevibacterium gallinarum]